MAVADINASLEAIARAQAAMRPDTASPKTFDPAGTQQAMQEHTAASARLWFSLNALLNIVANVSKMLWPAKGRKLAKEFPDRGEALREGFGVKDGSPLRYRTVRDHFEHVDERLESWWLESERHNIATRTLGPLGGAAFGGALEEKEIFEQFDPASLTVAFQGDLFELQPIADEISGLLDAVNTAEQARFTPPDS